MFLIKIIKRNKGVISIEYKDLDQLNKLIDIIKNKLLDYNVFI